MLEPSTLIVFATTALVLLLVPGPAVIYIVARGIHQGRWAALVSAWAVGLGNFVHATAAALGLSALLMSSALVFSVVKYLGAAYLIFLGIRTLLARGDGAQLAAPPPRSLRQVFRQGVVVSVLNPKTALFFVAFLPQFVDPSRGSATGQVLLLGVLFVALGIGTDSAYALLSGTLGGWLRRSASFQRRQRLFSGGVYVALGTGTALADGGK
jgi:threonine/homoserine/homoserine lactone efflux protein